MGSLLDGHRCGILPHFLSEPLRGSLQSSQRHHQLILHFGSHTPVPSLGSLQKVRPSCLTLKITLSESVLMLMVAEVDAPPALHWEPPVPSHGGSGENPPSSL